MADHKELTRDLGLRVFAARRAQPGKVTQAQAAEEFGLTRATWAAIEVGRVRASNQLLDAMSAHWGIPKSWWFSPPGTPLPTTPREDPLWGLDLVPSVTMELMGSVPGVFPVLGELVDSIRVPIIFNSQSCFATTVKDDANYPLLQPGDTAIWEAGNFRHSTSIHLMQRHETRETIAREWVRKEGPSLTISMVATNPYTGEYPDIQLDRIWHDVGGLVGVVRRRGTALLVLSNTLDGLRASDGINFF